MDDCDAKCLTERRVYCKELLRSGKSLLASIGLEQVSLRTAGPRYWKAFNSAVKVSTKASETDWSPGPCQWCSNGNPKDENLKEKNMLSSKFFDLQQKLDPNGMLSKPESTSTTSSQPLNFDHIFKIDPPKDRATILNPSLLPSYFPGGINPFSTSSMNGMFSWPNTGQMPSMFNFTNSNMKYKSEAEMLQQRMSQWQQLMSMHFNMLQMSTNKSPVMEPVHGASANHLSVPSFNPTAQNKHRASPSAKSKSPTITTITIEDDDMPLDLSIGNKRRSENASVPKSDTNTLDLDDQEIKPFSPASMASEISTKVYSVNKKNYSQADLDAAVTDIRCGRLGTRRASVVYGIPRSTLRNKIYKLEAAEDGNGENAAKRRRLNAYTTKKKDKEPPKICTNLEHSCTDSGSTSIAPNEAAQTMSPLTVNSTATPPSMSPFVLSNPPILPSLNSLSDLLKRYVENNNSSSENGGLGNGPLTETMTTSSDEMEVKKARPKRGQYRKYDKTALDKAVASVRKGEMSVHRAGSYYGVPHSTLEYKVKERNLLRNKRRNNEETIKNDEIIAEATEPTEPTSDSPASNDTREKSNSLEPTESVASNSNTSTSD